MSGSLDQANDQDVHELVGYLESNDINVVAQVKQVIHENLYAAKDSGVVNALADCYVQTKSDHLLEILVGVNDVQAQSSLLPIVNGLTIIICVKAPPSLCKREDEGVLQSFGMFAPKAQYLFDKMNDYLRHGVYNETSSILAAIIRRQPSWLYKIVHTTFFSNYLKFLKNESDVVVAMSGALILSTLLPCVPSSVADYLGDILEVFVRISSLILYKPGALPDILVLHLQIGAYIFFHRLYAMYPNNFLSYIKSHFGPSSRRNDRVFQQVIKPMLQFVKFHPGLVVETSKSETENEKWKTFQPHDIVSECQKISLDPYDAVKEAAYTVFPNTLVHGDLGDTNITTSLVVSTAVTTSTSISESRAHPASADKEPRREHRPEQPKDDYVSYLSSQELSTHFSPSLLCGLSTPPSSRTISPAGSAQDLISLHELGNRPVTPLLSGLDARDGSAQHAGDGVTTSTPLDRRKSDDEKSLLKKHSTGSSPFLTRDSPKVKRETAESSSRKGLKALQLSLGRSDSREQDYDFDTSKSDSSKSGTTTPPKAKKDKTDDKQSKSRDKHPTAKHSPRLKRTDSSRSTHANISSYSAPGTPLVGAKESSFQFVPSQAGNVSHSGSRPGSQFIPHTGSVWHDTRGSAKASPAVSRSESPTAEITHVRDISFLKVIQDLNQELLPKVSGVHSGQTADGQELTETCCQRPKVKSPFELLDEFIECGSNMHSAELSRIPLTSQLDTDWTYFGGSTPADELSILKHQVTLLKLQLQYERHKCELHVLRNRRLVGKVHKAQMFIDEANALKNKLALLEAEHKEAMFALKLREEELRQSKEFASSAERKHLMTLQTYSEQNKTLAYHVEELQEECESKEKAIAQLEKEIKGFQHQLFDAKTEMQMLKPKLDVNSTVQAKADNLARELLVHHEKYEKVKNKLKVFSAYCTKAEEEQMLAFTLKKELEDFQSENDCLTSSLDSAKLRIADLEATLAKKEMTIKEQKKEMESLRCKHESDIKAIEEKYQCLKKTCQGLQSYITKLYANLEESGQPIKIVSVTTTGSRSSTPHTHEDRKKADHSSSRTNLKSLGDLHSLAGLSRSGSLTKSEKLVGDSGIEASGSSDKRNEDKG